MARPGPGLRLGRRFEGPPGMANGGYACGVFAALLGRGGAEVTLRRPIPLERPLAARRDGDGGQAVEDGGALLAEVRPAAEVELAAPAVTGAQARAVAGRSRDYDDPVFPGCFVCGPSRAPGDGLRVFPGALAGRGLWAAPWTPDPSVAGADGAVRPEMVWAALDCPGGIAARGRRPAPRRGHRAGPDDGPRGRVAPGRRRLPRGRLAGRPRRPQARRHRRPARAGRRGAGRGGHVWLTVPRSSVAAGAEASS
jgi:hypothetical protein